MATNQTHQNSKTNQTSGPASKPEAKPAEKPAEKTSNLATLFELYEKAELALEAAQVELEKKTKEKSDTVKAIAEEAERLGLGNRPLDWKGRNLSVSSRQAYEETTGPDGKKVKTPVGEPTYFFRGPRQAAFKI